MSDRITRLRASLEEPLLVTTPVNVRYLTGFESTNAAVLVEHERVRLFTDFRYAEAGRRVAGVELTETRRDLVGNLAEVLEGRIAFEAAHLPYAGYETLAAAGIELVPTRNVVEALRAVKDEDEIRSIRQATEITNAVYERLAGERFVGRSERELAWWIEQVFHDFGAEGPAFPVVVAAGANGSRPHARSGERAIERGQTVVVDAGCVVEGYCSDCTRTFATGPLADALAEAYAICLDGQRSGLEAVRPGAAGAAVDGVARRRIAEAGFGEAFGHGLGHGVGLLAHEAPRLSQESRDELAAGNVVTVEPGLYLEGIGGVRIEDLVVVRDGAAEVLTSFTKELVTVG